MNRRRPQPAEPVEVTVEELDVAAWGHDGERAAPPPLGPPLVDAAPGIADPPPDAAPGESVTPPPGAALRIGQPARELRWWRRSGNQLAAAAVAVVVLVVALGLASGGAEDPASSPTTEPATTGPSRPTSPPRPVSTPAPSTTSPAASGPTVDGEVGDERTDFRFALAERPPGFEIVAAYLVEPPDVVVGRMRPPDPAVFTGDDATWTAGPWLIMSVSDPQFGPWNRFGFRRPPAMSSIGEAEVHTGEADGGIELTVLRHGGTEVEIAARGLDPLATVAVAEQIRIAGGGVAWSDAAVPTGLSLRRGLRLPTGPWDQLADVRAAMTLSSDGPTSLDVVVGPARGSNWLSEATFLLDDLRYVSIRGDVGVAGTTTLWGGAPEPVVRWRRADREYVVRGWGTTIDDVVQVASTILEPGQPDWRGARWDEAVQEAAQCCTDDSPYVEPDWVDVPAASAGDASWTVQAGVAGDAVHWNLVGEQAGLGVTTPLRAPWVQVTATSDWQSHDFTAAAVALADRSLSGAVLRLSATGTAAPRTVEIPLQPVDGAALPLLAAAVVMPWTEGGFIAQLIGPDGRTIAMQSDRELP